MIYLPLSVSNFSFNFTASLRQTYLVTRGMNLSIFTLQKIVSSHRLLTQMSSRSLCSANTGGTFTTTKKRHPSASTIYALSSGQGKCGVAVVRISGSGAMEAIRKMTKITNPQPRRAHLSRIFDPETREIIDQSLCLWFPGPHSFTGEDSVEFQVHGGPAILAALMEALTKLKFEPALPGEFTRRAFHNGKLDLTEVEGLADLIHAETEQQRRQALLQAAGSLSKLYKNWHKILSQSLANVEAYIDFSEDDNIESDVLKNCNSTLEKLSKCIAEHLEDDRKGEILRNGVRTVIIGEPNVGKSSLLNILVQRNAAIVTPIAGTTRDIVELNANISGYPVILADTAGLAESTQDVVEAEGMKRAKNYAKSADFIVIMIDASVLIASKKTIDGYIDDYIDDLQLEDSPMKNGKLSSNCLIVANKIDLIDEKYKKSLENRGIVLISCTNEDGLKNLLKSMTERFGKICGNPSRENPTISQSRHRTHLKNCLNYLSEYLVMSSQERYDMVIAAQEIRNAMRELGKITGHVSTEEILDIIFQNFCIGK